MTLDLTPNNTQDLKQDVSVVKLAGNSDHSAITFKHQSKVESFPRKSDVLHLISKEESSKEWFRKKLKGGVRKVKSLQGKGGLELGNIMPF